MASESIVTDEERRSSAWKTIKAYIDKRVVMLDVSNRKDLSKIETFKIRGAINELEQLVKAIEPEVIVHNEADKDFYQ